MSKGIPRLSPSNVAGYYELHIEQGPLFEAKELAAAVATEIRGNTRYTKERCVRGYAHSAAVPRAFRSDAVLATAELVARLDAFWQEVEVATTGHEAAIFTSAGIPSGMIFVRNAYGSHNANEPMDLDDFAEGRRVLVAVLAKRGCQR